MSELEVQTRELDDIVLLYPQGFINAHTVRLFESAIQKALKDNRFKIVVNCSGLAYIASAGLGAIMGAIEEVRGNGGDRNIGFQPPVPGFSLRDGGDPELPPGRGSRRLRP